MLILTNYTITGLLVMAFNRRSAYIDGPAWIGDDKFNISARVPAGTTYQELTLMMQNLLAERFRMEFHRESRQSPWYVLVQAKKGARMTAAAGSGEPLCAYPPDWFSPSKSRRFLPGQREYVCGNMTMDAFAAWLPKTLLLDIQYPVLNETGLDGTFDFRLSYFSKGYGPGLEQTRPLPDIFQALEKQLGLKLEVKQRPTEFLVLDHIERTPTEN